MATAALPRDPDLDQLRTQARELQRAVRSGTPEALTRVTKWRLGPPDVNEVRGVTPLAGPTLSGSEPRYVRGAPPPNWQIREPPRPRWSPVRPARLGRVRR